MNGFSVALQEFTYLTRVLDSNYCYHEGVYLHVGGRSLGHGVDVQSSIATSLQIFTYSRHRDILFLSQD
jgi:hypothetical protein